MISLQLAKADRKYIFEGQPIEEDREDVVLLKNTGTYPVRVFKVIQNSISTIDLFNFGPYEYLKNTIPENSEDYPLGSWEPSYYFEDGLVLEPKEYIPLLFSLTPEEKASGRDIKSLNIEAIWAEEV